MRQLGQRIAFVRTPLPGPKSRQMLDRWRSVEANTTGYQAPVVWDRVNGVAPGYIATEMNRALVDDEEFTTWVLDNTPLRRWGRAEDIGPVAVFLASDAAAFITGQTIFVDGGWMAAL